MRPAVTPGRGRARLPELEVPRVQPQARPISAQSLRSGGPSAAFAVLEALQEHWRQSQQVAAAAGAAPPAPASVAASSSVATLRHRRRQRLIRAGAIAGRQQPSTQQLPPVADQPSPPLKRGRPMAAEQRQLAAAAMAGDDRAAAILVHANRPLVQYLATRYLNKGLPREDLVAEGMLALERASRRYCPQPNRPASFGTFAATTICNAMMRAIQTQSRNVRLPVHHYRDMARVRQSTLELATELIRQPTCAEVAERCGFTVSYTLHLLRAMASQQGGSPLSLVVENEEGMPLPMDEDYHQSAISLEGSEEEALEDVHAREEWCLLLGAQLRSCLTRLDPDEARVFELRYGLDDGSGRQRMYKEVAAHFNRTASWASDKCRAAERKLRALMHGVRVQQPQQGLPSQGRDSGGPSSNSSCFGSSRSWGVGASLGFASSEGKASRADAMTQRDAPLDPSLAIADALTSLTPLEHLAVALRHGWLDGSGHKLSYKEMGARMNRSLNGASSLCCTAEAVMRARLMALGHEQLDLAQLHFSPRQRQAWHQQLHQLQQRPCKARRGTRDKPSGRRAGKRGKPCRPAIQHKCGASAPRGKEGGSGKSGSGREPAGGSSSSSGGGEEGGQAGPALSESGGQVAHLPAHRQASTQLRPAPVSSSSLHLLLSSSAQPRDTVDASCDTSSSTTTATATHTGNLSSSRRSCSSGEHGRILPQLTTKTMEGAAAFANNAVVAAPDPRRARSFAEAVARLRRQEQSLHLAGRTAIAAH